MQDNSLLQAILLALVFGGSVTATMFGSSYMVSVITELAIAAIFSLSIDLLVGYTGLVTFGHAGFMGVGAYAFTFLSSRLGLAVGSSIIGGVTIGALSAFIVGLLVVRLRGVFFIMVTLAISMMFYSWAFKAHSFGADDGMTGLKRLDLHAIGLNLNNPRTFALSCIALVLVTFVIMRVLVKSPFGQTLRAIKQNEGRTRAQGCPVRLYKLAAFIIAGAFASLAGIVSVQNTLFLHPNLAFWLRSGEGLVTVIIGGAGTLIGPILGTYFFVLLHRIVEAYTQYWQLVAGLSIIALLLVARQGIYGGLEKLWTLIAARFARPVGLFDAARDET